MARAQAQAQVCLDLLELEEWLALVELVQQLVLPQRAQLELGVPLVSSPRSSLNRCGQARRMRWSLTSPLAETRTSKVCACVLIPLAIRTVLTLSLYTHRIHTALLKALQSLEGYELFRELETIAGDFKSLAWRYSELKWYKQALDCHRLAELIHVEMSFIPAKLSRFNFVNPDANDIKLMWSYYTQRTPLKEADVAVGSSDYMVRLQRWGDLRAYSGLCYSYAVLQPSRRSSLELLRAKRSEEEERGMHFTKLVVGDAFKSLRAHTRLPSACQYSLYNDGRCCLQPWLVRDSPPGSWSCSSQTPS